jgi:hypothetical protein
MASETNPKKRKLDIDEVATALSNLGIADKKQGCTDIVLYGTNPPPSQTLPSTGFHPGKLSVFNLTSYPAGFEVRKVGRFGIPIVHKKQMYTAEEVDTIIQQRENILYDGYRRLTRDLSFWRQKATCKHSTPER